MENFLKPRVPECEFSKFGFRKCKGMYGRNGCYYTLVRADNKMLFVSKEIFTVSDISDDDPRIHKNRRYFDTIMRLNTKVIDSYHVVKILTERGFFRMEK